MGSELTKATETELQSAALKFSRNIAATLVIAIAESGLSYRQVDRRLSVKPGWAKQTINGLIDGSLVDAEDGLRVAADFCVACGVELVPSIHRRASLAKEGKSDD